MSQYDGSAPELAYDGYSDWKNWNTFFQFSANDASYFEQELLGVDLRGKRVLEIGFGEGRFLAWAQAKGALVEGIELDARAIAAAETAGIALASQSITDQAKIAPGAYGLIAAFDVFEHMTVDQIKDHLAAIALLLKTGGLLALRYPNGQSPFGLAPQHGDVTHITPLSRVKIEQMATRHGFYTVRYAGAAEPRGSGIGRIGRMFRKSIRRIFGGVLNFVFGQTIIWDSVVTHVLRRD